MNLVIIQARYDSTRFPGKILKKINGKSILEIIILRIKKRKQVEKIVVATTKEKNDNKIIDQIRKLNIDIYRGSTKNVLQDIILQLILLSTKLKM